MDGRDLFRVIRERDLPRMLSYLSPELLHVV
jgi:hypothetical protein